MGLNADWYIFKGKKAIGLINWFTILLHLAIL